MTDTYVPPEPDETALADLSADDISSPDNVLGGDPLAGEPPAYQAPDFAKSLQQRASTDPARAFAGTDAVLEKTEAIKAANDAEGRRDDLGLYPQDAPRPKDETNRERADAEIAEARAQVEGEGLTEPDATVAVVDEDAYDRTLPEGHAGTGVSE